MALVERFEQHAESYRSGVYNEAQLRKEFVDPMFKTLGWDMDNLSGYAEAYKDVIHEDAIKIGGATKAPDYCFRIGGTRKFFLEAKKPSVDIKSDANPAFQLRRYAWSAKLPLSILTDFQEFAVYDCRVAPSLNDKAAVARVLYLNFTEYASRWEDISKIFSREAILKGSFDKFAESNKTKRGTAQVDDAFLYEIEKWRADLARNVASRNPKLSQRDLNFSVQRTIDRIVFLRICEDRRIEVYGRLQALLNGEHTYDRMRQLFRLADERYNSGLFHFQKEKNRVEPPDDLTPGLEIDDAILKKIIKRLYYPESPYEFSVLPADILGQVYEQFLGKVIRLTEGHQAKVEDKPEVKKAGGVYYTPTFIVEYIVKSTVGKLLENKTPTQAAKLRILDPACGSGSFLIGAYQYLLDWHRDWLVNHEPKKRATGRAPVIYQASGGEWKLTTTERKRILLQNIFGVDIDAQAVETTKLSLLLKVLEGESEQSLATQLRFFHERALPDLGSNIKCGNSLIGPDFYDQMELRPLDEEERYRINVFDWDAEFPEIMKVGGFDAVIGNPPYIDVKELPDLIKAELSRVYSSATRRFDLYVPFVEKGLSLLSNGGLMSFIIPSMFMRREYGAALREVILKNSQVRSVVDFGTNQIFAGPLNYVAILLFAKNRIRANVDITKFSRTGLTTSEITNTLKGARCLGVSIFSIEHDLLTSKEWQLLDRRESELANRLFRTFEPLERLVRFASEGIHSGKDEVFFVSHDILRQRKLETPPVFPLARGKDIHRYEDADGQTYATSVIYPYDLSTGQVLSPANLESNAPNTWSYLLDSRPTLRGRPYFEKSSKAWYELWCPRDPTLYVNSKILGPEIANRGEFTLTKKPLFVNNKLKVIVLQKSIQEGSQYVLGLLNSTLLTYLHRLIAPPKGNNYFEVKTRVVGKLPIRRINFSNAADKSRHDRTVELVEQMLALHKQLGGTKTAHARTNIERQIDATDVQIDKLVYELYGLTEDEIKIVDGTAA